MPGTVPGSSVRDFFNDGKIFLTGGTGFLGKALIEKFLRVCTNVDHIYLLIRVKKGKDPQTRLKELFNDPLFGPIRKENPDFEKKVTCISGDVSSPKMNMSDDDYNFLTREVTHVIHSAATVRFNESLKNAIRINVLGTREIVEFCNKCVHLKIFVHVSTAYSNCHQNTVEEEYCDPPLSGEAAIYLSEVLNEEKMNAMTPEFIRPWPNTYSFTKAIAENVVKEGAKAIPTVLFRPGIVMGALKEPLRGWIDNIYGPTGIIVAVGVGLMRVIYADASKHANIVPVDLTINALLSSAWEVGTSFNNNTITENSLDVAKDNVECDKHTETTPKIFNYVASQKNIINWGTFLQLNLKYGKRLPSIKAIWYYGVILTKFRSIYKILTVFLHLLPAALADGVCLLLGKKPQIWNAYKKIHTFSDVMIIFAANQWNFSNGNVRKLWTRLSDADKEIFQFDMDAIVWEDYFSGVIAGIRSYIFNESEDTLPGAKRKMFFFWMGHRLIQFGLIVFCFWILSKILFFFL